MPGAKVKKLTHLEFFTVYGISLLEAKAEEHDREYLAGLLTPQAEKYRDITLYALRSELRHFLCGGADPNGGGIAIENRQANLDLLHKLKKTWGRSTRNLLSIDEIIILFKDGAWEVQYGGNPWEDIAKVCKKLIDSLPATRFNLKKVITHIDRLNDLEHNNSLYLVTYSTFNLEDALDIKRIVAPDELIKYCSSELQRMYREQQKSKATY